MVKAVNAKTFFLPVEEIWKLVNILRLATPLPRRPCHQTLFNFDISFLSDKRKADVNCNIRSLCSPSCL